MSDRARASPGFPGIGKATAIPNLFFSTVLPRLEIAGSLAGVSLGLPAVPRNSAPSSAASTRRRDLGQRRAPAELRGLGGGRAGLGRGARSAACGCVRCVALRVRGAGGDEAVYFLNNPVSRRTIARARAGEISLRPETAVVAIEPLEQRPGIFRLYEEHIGTITPMVGERLVDARRPLSGGVDRGRLPRGRRIERAQLALHRTHPEELGRGGPSQ